MVFRTIPESDWVKLEIQVSKDQSIGFFSIKITQAGSNE